MYMYIDRFIISLTNIDPTENRLENVSPILDQRRHILLSYGHPDIWVQGRHTWLGHMIVINARHTRRKGANLSHFRRRQINGLIST